MEWFWVTKNKVLVSRLYFQYTMRTRVSYWRSLWTQYFPSVRLATQGMTYPQVCFRQKILAGHSQCTVRDARADTLPTRFSASHMYSPSSTGSTFSIRSDLSSRICARPIGIFPSSLRHRMLGSGSPPTRHWNCTLWPFSTVTSDGSLLKNGFTVTRTIFVWHFVAMQDCHTRRLADIKQWEQTVMLSGKTHL